jgi:hypothetical protein
MWLPSHHIGAKWRQYGNPVQLLSHVGGVGCETEAVFTTHELCVVIWEVYGIVWQPDAPVWSHAILLGAMWCCMESSAIWEPYFPTWEICVTIQELHAPYVTHMGQTGGIQGLALRLARHGYIGFYSGTMRATFGSTVVKERWCRACRRLVESPPVLANGGIENGARGGIGPRSAQRTCRE